MAVARAAKLILTLVDRTSGPARTIQAALGGVSNAVRGFTAAAMAPSRALAASGRAFRRHASDVAVASGALSLGLAKAGKAIYDMEDVLNEIEGRRFGKNLFIDLADGTKMGREAFRKSVVDLVTTIDKESPRNADEIARAYNQLVQAGLSHEQVHAVLPVTIDFAIAGNYEAEEAADRLTNVMTSMQMPMATFQDALTSAKRAADVIAYAANITNADVREMTESFKYAAPLAAALGIDIEQLAAMFAIQAQRGIKASEAGVSIRAMLVRMIRPTKMAAAALQQYNIDLADYLVQSREVTSGDVVNALLVGGLDAKAAIGEIDKILTSSLGTTEKVAKLTQLITKTVGDKSTMSADTISEVLREVLYSFGEKLDVDRLIEDMQKANIAVSDFFKIFDVRQGARTMALFADDIGHWTDRIRKGAEGFSEAMSQVRMQGIVGAVQRFSSALFGLFRAIADSGVLDAVTNAFVAVAAAINNIAKLNPTLLEFGTYAVIGLAALGPLGFAMAGLAAAASLLVNPITLVGAALGTIAVLNFGKIKQYALGFAGGVRKAFGPETARLINSTKEAFLGLFRSFGDGSVWGPGRSHGMMLAGGIESAIVFIKKSAADLKAAVASFLALPEMQAYVGALTAAFNSVKETAGAAGRAIYGFGEGVAAFWRSFLSSLTPQTSAAVDGLVSAFSEGVVRLLGRLKSYFSSVAEVMASFNVNFRTLGEAMGEAAAANVDRLISAIKRVVDAFAWVIEKAAAAKDAVVNFFSSGGGAPAGGGGSTSYPGVGLNRPGGRGAGSLGVDSAGRAMGPGRAKGGPVRKGLTYPVGEEGVEFFSPNEDGHITSNKDLRAALGGGSQIIVKAPISITVNGAGDIARQVKGAVSEAVAEIGDTLDRQLRRHSQTAFSSVRYGDK